MLRLRHMLRYTLRPRLRLRLSVSSILHPSPSFHASDTIRKRNVRSDKKCLPESSYVPDPTTFCYSSSVPAKLVPQRRRAIWHNIRKLTSKLIALIASVSFFLHTSHMQHATTFGELFHEDLADVSCPLLSNVQAILTCSRGHDEGAVTTTSSPLPHLIFSGMRQGVAYISFPARPPAPPCCSHQRTLQVGPTPSHLECHDHYK